MNVNFNGICHNSLTVELDRQKVHLHILLRINIQCNSTISHMYTFGRKREGPPATKSQPPPIEQKNYTKEINFEKQYTKVGTKILYHNTMKLFFYQ